MSFTIDPEEVDAHRKKIVGLQETAQGEIVAQASKEKTLLAYGLMYYGVVGFWMMVANRNTVQVVEGGGDALEYTAGTLGTILELTADTELTHTQLARQVADEVDELDGRIS